MAVSDGLHHTEALSARPLGPREPFVPTLPWDGSLKTTSYHFFSFILHLLSSFLLFFSLCPPLSYLLCYILLHNNITMNLVA